MWSNLILRPVRRLLRDRRGISSIVFAGSSIGLVGALALATEASVWYTVQRNAQAAADAAALAAASNMPAGETTALASGASAATKNGFTTGTAGSAVTITFPSGFATRNLQAQAVVSQPQPPGLASLFATPPTVRAVARAELRPASDICMLATGQLRFAGSPNVTANGCALAANSRASNAVDISGNPPITAASISTRGLCSGCTTGDPPVLQRNLTLTDGLRQLDFETPIPPSFRNLDSLTLPTTNGAGACLTPAGAAATGALVTTARGGLRSTTGTPWESCPRVITSIANNPGNIDLAPGTYVFNTSLTLNGGEQVRCSACTGGRGVTLIFLGDNRISISGGSGIVLNAPKIGPASGSWFGDGALQGILIYRRNNGTALNFDFTGNTGTTRLSGGIYTPGATLDFTGNTGTAGCAVWVAANISLRGNPTVDTTRCADDFGTEVPSTQRLRLVQPS